MRRIVTNAIGVVLLLYAGIVVVGLVASAGWFHGRLPPDTLPANASQAEDVAFSVASNAGCGEFEGGPPSSAAATWTFSCSIGDVPYDITVFGGNDARTAGLAELRADGRPFVAKAYYAVTALRTGASKEAALTATPPPDAVMDPFR